MKLPIIKTLFFSILVLTIVAFPIQAFAAPYGSGTYGEGVYNVGEVTTSSSSSSSGSSLDTKQCTAAKPDSTPDLFQINAKKESVSLYFSPSSGNRDRYYVMYGLTSGAEQYGFEFQNSASGVINVEISALKANTTYYFKVRAGNGCKPGDWSNELAVETGQRLPTYRWSSVGKIFDANVIGRAYPNSTSKIKASAEKVSQNSENSSSTPEINQASPIPLASAKPTSAPQKQTSPAQPASPSFMDSVSNFFKSLFGK
jgi:hypothetical protein